MYNWLKKPSVKQNMYNQTDANDMYKWQKSSNTAQRTQSFYEADDTDKATSCINEVYSYNSVDSKKSYSLDITSKNMQEAVIWSEILGKPACKRRKRRYQCQ